jgi:hypothetical protein
MKIITIISIFVYLVLTLEYGDNTDLTLTKRIIYKHKEKQELKHMETTTK